MKAKKRKKKKQKFGEKEMIRLEVFLTGGVLFLLFIFLVASFLIPRYTVLFLSNGGTQIPAQKIEKNEKVKRPEDPKREGYRFIGWYLEEDLYDFDSSIHQDLSLVAHWQKLEEYVEKIVLNQESLRLEPLEDFLLEATITPENATEKLVAWTSSNPKVATVEDGLVHALSEGNTIITAITRDGGLQATCQVTVQKKVLGITLLQSEYALEVGEKTSLELEVEPKVSMEELLYRSRNETVVTIEKGTLTAVGEGTTIVDIATPDKKYSAKVVVTVTAPPLEDIQIQGKSTLVIGESTNLTILTTPSNASFKGVYWKSSNPLSVSVDATGSVTAKAKGTSIITAWTKDGKKVTRHTITVRDSSTSE